jgi:hypothetical protein
MNRPTLYFRLSLIWQAILAGGPHFVVLVKAFDEPYDCPVPSLDRGSLNLNVAPP